MKLIVKFFLMVSVFFSFTSLAFCQSKNTTNTTVIIVRHAEKQTGDDPALTEAGMKRAEKLSSLFPGTKPDEIYTTPYVRTRQTITPWAKEAGVEMKEYNPKNLQELVTYLKTLEGKTILIAGHSNTNPQLVNLLINEEKYKNLDESDYSTQYIITLKDGVGTAKVLKN